MANFKDDKMSYIESDIEKIQTKTGMYISYYGEKGSLHLAKEAIQNSIDECENRNSPAKNIYIKLDISTDTLTVEDDGRGIPEDDYPLDIVCTKLQSGSKFSREQSGNSAGENGVGLTATNALSTHFSLSTFRGGKEHTVVFSEGHKVNDINKTSKNKLHGTRTEFSPSKKYLGPKAKIPKTGLIEWVDMISYFIPDKARIKLEVYKAGKLLETHKFKNRPISELLEKKISGTKLSNTFTLKDKMKIDETIRDDQGKNKVVSRNLSIEFAFNYTDTLEPYTDSFCNYINTTSGGVHIDATKEAIWRYFMKKCQENMSDREKELYKVLKVDIENGLNTVTNLSTDIQMHLVGQTKNAVGNDELYDPIKNLVTIQLEQFFGNNKDKLMNIVKIIKLNTKARVDAAKIKAPTIAKSKNKFDQFKYDMFTPCNNSGKAYKELHICEGKSAAGSLVDGRDPDTQAFLAFRGVTANGFKRDLSTILDNGEWRTYVTLLGTDIGPKFDINKCNYDKIVIDTDADIDGHGITSGIGAFHAIYMPELVMSGRLYKALPPLYNIDDKSMPYVRNKQEFVEVYQKKIIKNFDIKVLIDSKTNTLSDKEFKEFIFDTQDYSAELLRIANHYGANKFLIERIIFFITIYLSKTNKDVNSLFSTDKTTSGFMKYIQEKFPEMKYTGNQTITGVADGRYQSININNRFIKQIPYIQETFIKYGLDLSVKENDKFKNKSIGQFLDMCEKFVPKIITRYKGLGEMNSEQLWETTLNPNTRILIQLTMEDCEKDLRVFEKLHGTSKQNLEDRKDMMRNFLIKREDLDN